MGTRMSLATQLRLSCGGLFHRHIYKYILQLGERVLNLDGPALRKLAVHCDRLDELPLGTTSMPPFPRLGCRVPGSNYAGVCECIFSTALLESFAGIAEELGSFGMLQMSVADMYCCLATVRDRVGTRVRLTGMPIVAAPHVARCNPVQAMLDFLYAVFAGNHDLLFLPEDVQSRLYATRLETGLHDEADPVL
ncbi:hypothetical protein SCUCBS95973_001376 [Sporothrix curviconia]|uniref:Uncharacterized protein n=1 Tax=Sporothrix curviconia TaxID=1260050 RepID=A0ABP0AY53_9PEZI